MGKAEFTETKFMTRAPSTIVLLITLTLGTNPSLGNPPSEGVREDVALSIQTKQMSASQFVFVKHKGPYWQLSRTIETLTAHMKQYHQDGPILIRYEGSPRSPRFSNHLRVGFHTQDESKLQSPFEQVQDQAALVVYATVAAGSLSPSRSYALLGEWASQHDFVIVGPLTEVYAYPRTDKAAALATMVVRLGVRKQASRPTLTTKADAHLLGASDQAAKMTTKTTAVPKTLASQVGREDSGPIEPTATSMVKRSQSVEKEITANADHVTEAPGMRASPALMASASLPVIESHGSLESVRMETKVTFEPVVDLLFSAFSFGDRRNQKPLVKLISRIQAIAQGGGRRFPGQASRLKELAELMNSRLAAQQFQSANGYYVSRPVPAATEDSNKPLRTATQQLEVVMVGIGYRTISPTKALVRVVTILREAVEDYTNAPASPFVSLESP